MQICLWSRDFISLGIYSEGYWIVIIRLISLETSVLFSKLNYHQHISVYTALPTNAIFLLWMLLFWGIVSQCNLNWPSTNDLVTSQPFSCCVYKQVLPGLSWYVLTFWWHHSSERNVILAWYFWFFCSCLLMTLNRCPNHSISVLAIFNVFFEEMTFLLTWSFLSQAIYFSM